MLVLRLLTDTVVGQVSNFLVRANSHGLKNGGERPTRSFPVRGVVEEIACKHVRPFGVLWEQEVNQVASVHDEGF
ncbi:MAG: hypothetical protein IH965_12060 [Gemmatimonadetes bacterium]|nr:hypothetical protein [Gemmatimonadota bacterium]